MYVAWSARVGQRAGVCCWRLFVPTSCACASCCLCCQGLCWEVRTVERESPSLLAAAAVPCVSISLLCLLACSQLCAVLSSGAHAWACGGCCLFFGQICRILLLWSPAWERMRVGVFSGCLLCAVLTTNSGTFGRRACVPLFVHVCAFHA